MENWQIFSIFGYPVAEEQLKILNSIGISGNISLMFLRIISLLVLIASLSLWVKSVMKVAPRILAILSLILVLISPLVFVLWLIYPFMCLKFFVFTLLIWLGLKNKYCFWLLPLILIIFNWQVLGDKAAIFYKLNLKDAQEEVTKRISGEDSLLESISMPLWWRRISYNKYFFTYKQIVAEALPFFDFESVFFQEINPLAQKSIVIFFWPEIYLFILGLYVLVTLKNKKLNSFLLISLAMVWIDFIFSEGPVFMRLALIILPVSVILALGFHKLCQLVFQKRVLAIFSLILVSTLIVFGYLNSIYDLSMRRDLWLDNRPLAFKFWFEELDKLDLNKYESIQVSSLVGDAKSYCYFYLGKKCKDDKFTFDSFDLENDKGKVRSVYAGFGGEFVGSRFKNDISVSWVNQARERGINIITVKSLRDTIANRYGNDIGIGIVE